MGKNYIADNYVLALRYFRKKKKHTLLHLKGFSFILPPKEPMIIVSSANEPSWEKP